MNLPSFFHKPLLFAVYFVVILIRATPYEKISNEKVLLFYSIGNFSYIMNKIVHEKREKNLTSRVFTNFTSLSAKKFE